MVIKTNPIVAELPCNETAYRLDTYIVYFSYSHTRAIQMERKQKLYDKKSPDEQVVEVQSTDLTYLAKYATKQLDRFRHLSRVAI